MITPMLFNINVKKNNISRYLPKKKVSFLYKRETNCPAAVTKYA